MAGTMYIDLDHEPMSDGECSMLVHNGSEGRLAYFGEDGHIELLTVSYAVDAGTIVCYIPASTIARDRAVPVTFEAYGTSTDDAWSVVLKGRARSIVRDTDVKMVELLLCRAAAPGEIPLRVMADTMSGTRSRPARTLARAVEAS